MLTMGIVDDEREESTSGGIALLAAVLTAEARVESARATLAAATRRLAVLQARFARLGRPAAAIAATCLGEAIGDKVLVMEARDGSTMRARILERLARCPDEVFTPATLGPLVGAGSRDSVRNTLLALAARGQIDKLGPGRYTAKRDARLATPTDDRAT
jgi:hypothetical protein